MCTLRLILRLYCCDEVLQSKLVSHVICDNINPNFERKVDLFDNKAKTNAEG